MYVPGIDIDSGCLAVEQKSHDFKVATISPGALGGTKERGLLPVIVGLVNLDIAVCHEDFEYPNLAVHCRNASRGTDSAVDGGVVNVEAGFEQSLHSPSIVLSDDSVDRGWLTA